MSNRERRFIANKERRQGAIDCANIMMDMLFDLNPTKGQVSKFLFVKDLFHEIMAELATSEFVALGHLADFRRDPIFRFRDALP
jgi:hypothetical protein